jgi:G3E family GTPase
VEALKQIAVADHLLISKADLVKDQALNELRDQLRAINPSADQHIIAHGLYDASFVLSASLYDPHTKTYDVQKWLHDEKLSHHHHHHHHDVNRHNASIAAFCLRSENAIKPEQLELFIEFLRQLYGAHMLRVKGIICVDDDRQRPVVIHGVQHVFHPAVRLDHWPSDDHSTRIVFILYNLKEDFIRGMWDVVMNKPMPDQADAQAMRDNPLGLDQHRGLLS